MKKGFTMFDNEILEAVMGAELNATEIKVLLTIIRYTMGYKREECNFSLNFIVSKTGNSKTAIVNAVKSLCDKQIIIKKIPKNTKSCTYSVNKAVLLEKYGTQKCDLKVQKSVPSMVNKALPYKYNNININNIYSVPTPKATAFSNFTPRKNIDYKKIEMDALRKKMERVL